MVEKAKERSLECPGCGGRTIEAYAEANYGRVVLVDQCQGCGGVWFDKWELYFVTPATLAGLSRVDTASILAEFKRPKGSGRCPCCTAVLKLYTDPAFPEDTAILRCPGCSGLWLNRGELARFARLRGANADETPPADSSDDPEKQSAGRVEALKRLQKELDTRAIAEPMVPVEGALEAADTGDIDPKEFAADVGFLVLQALLRLVFKF